MFEVDGGTRSCTYGPRDGYDSSPGSVRLDSSRASHVPAQRRARLEGNLYTGETINGRRVQKFHAGRLQQRQRVETTKIATT